MEEMLYSNITHDMSSGLFILDLDGRVQYINPAAEKLLGLDAQAARSHPLVQYFLEYSENEAFIQLILDAVYEKNHMQEGIVPFRSAEKQYMVRLKSSFLESGGECVGVICMMDDITELTELQDAVRAMNEIKRLNHSLTLRNNLLYETFGRYLSDDIVRQLLDTKDGLAMGGVKRELTVLMSDLRGFTALSERMPATELIRMLNHYLAAMTLIIQKHHGTIIEFMGDGILALFGAPAEIEHQAEHAVAAAIEMQAAMPEVNRWNTAEGYDELAMGIGVHTGDVIIGNIGSEKRTKYGAVGRNVNLCGRIESYTTAGQVLISEDTMQRVSAPLDIAETRLIRMKGLETPLNVLNVTGIGQPYHVSCAGCAPEEIPAPLAKPAQVLFHRLDGKTELPETLRAAVTAVGEKTMEIGADLPLYENIVLDCGGNLYAKVTKKEGGLCRLTLTAIPEGFSAWKAAL